MADSIEGSDAIDTCSYSSDKNSLIDSSEIVWNIIDDQSAYSEDSLWSSFLSNNGSNH